MPAAPEAAFHLVLTELFGPLALLAGVGALRPRAAARPPASLCRAPHPPCCLTN